MNDKNEDKSLADTLTEAKQEAVKVAEEAVSTTEEAVQKTHTEVKIGFDATRQALRHFFKLESAGGLLLMAAALVAMLFANTGLSPYYDVFLHTHLAITVDGLGVDKPFIYWINDGLMAVFFLLVGLEIKREVLEGELSSLDQAMLPCIAALGGITIPALIYAYFNQHDDVALHGWAIPAATDIAFALGVLSLFGKRVPISLKIFLTAVAVIDDLAAIVIIALFYTANLSTSSLLIALVCAAGLWLLNLSKSQRISAYIFIGILMWLAVLKSGVHATLAGVALGLLIPHRTKDKHGNSMLRELEHNLHPWVAFVVLPIFAFANAGIDFRELSLDVLTHPVPLGIAVGLFVGKQVGVFGFSFIAIKAGLAKLPSSITWLQFYGVALLCGIGFTMSLFIGSLAFDKAADLQVETRVGVMMGSLLSGIVGYLMIRYCVNKNSKLAEQKD